MTKDMTKELIQARIPPDMVIKIDKLVRKGYAINRSDFIRMAIGSYIRDRED